MSDEPKHLQYYDVAHTIAIALAFNPQNPDDPAYNREKIHSFLHRLGKIYVKNDGNDVLYVLISHTGEVQSSNEVPLYPGDLKEYYDVYELRLRSATQGLPYRVSEYSIRCCDPKTTFGAAQTVDFPTSVSLGLIPNYTVGNKLGMNDAIPSSGYIILSNVTSSAFPINFPSSAQQMQVVSTSTNDSVAGTGVQQVKLTYLTTPASGFQVNTEYISTNGITPVNTINTNIYRIERFESSQVGSGLFAAGNISLQSVGGVTTFEQIASGLNINRTCVHFVPGGMKSTLFGITKGSTTSGGVIFSIGKSFQYQGINVVNHGIDQLEMGNFSIHVIETPPSTIINTNNLEMFFSIIVKGRASNQAASATIRFIDSPI